MTKYYYIFLILSITSCGACDYTYQKQIGENYFLRAIDMKESMCIGFGTKDSNEGIVPSTIYEVQWNDDIILAKQHPNNSNETYYYLIRKTKFGLEKGTKYMEGPISEYEAKNILKEAGVKLPLENKEFFSDLTNTNKNLLSGEFEVDSTLLIIKEEWKYLQESEPELIRRLLQNQFLNKLMIGNKIQFLNDSILIHNDFDTISYYSTERQALNIRQSDMVRELNYYEWNNGGVVFEKTGKQGKYIYYLKRIS